MLSCQLNILSPNSALKLTPKVTHTVPDLLFVVLVRLFPCLGSSWSVYSTHRIDYMSLCPPFLCVVDVLLFWGGIRLLTWVHGAHQRQFFTSILTFLYLAHVTFWSPRVQLIPWTRNCLIVFKISSRACDTFGDSCQITPVPVTDTFTSFQPLSLVQHN